MATMRSFYKNTIFILSLTLSTIAFSASTSLDCLQKINNSIDKGQIHPLGIEDVVLMISDSYMPSERVKLNNLLKETIIAQMKISKERLSLMGSYRSFPISQYYLKQDYLKNVKYFSKNEQQESKVFIKNGLLVNKEGEAIDTKTAPSIGGSNQAIYVMDKFGELYIYNQHKINYIHHSSLLAGGDIAAAGMIEVEGGIIKHIDLESGHYKPPPNSMASVLDRLDFLNADLSLLKVEFLSEDHQKITLKNPLDR